VKSLRTIAACHESAVAALTDIRASDPVLFDRAHAHGLLEGRVRTALAQLRTGNPMLWEKRCDSPRPLGKLVCRSRTAGRGVGCPV